ncbi:MAG: hypothetical protein ACI8XB_001293 [Patiriisocius sp.]|jgi:hypothetical protein
MIKFFRRIRHQLLTENKFSKYLLYAIGEILLVVIVVRMPALAPALKGAPSHYQYNLKEHEKRSKF